jgi:hypothetical protein
MRGWVARIGQGAGSSGKKFRPPCVRCPCLLGIAARNPRPPHQPPPAPRIREFGPSESRQGQEKSARKGLKRTSALAGSALRSPARASQWDMPYIAAGERSGPGACAVVEGGYAVVTSLPWTLVLGAGAGALAVFAGPAASGLAVLVRFASVRLAAYGACRIEARSGALPPRRGPWWALAARCARPSRRGLEAVVRSVAVAVCTTPAAPIGAKRASVHTRP